METIQFSLIYILISTDQKVDIQLKFVNKEELNRARDGETLIGRTIHFKNIENLKFLIDNGADVNQTCGWWEGKQLTPIELAVTRESRLDMVLLLLENGAVFKNCVYAQMLIEKIFFNISNSHSDFIYFKLFEKTARFVKFLSLTPQLNYNTVDREAINNIIYDDDIQLSFTDDYYIRIKAKYSNISKYFTSLEGFYISKRNLCMKSIEWTANFIKNIPTLTHITIQDCSLYDEHIDAFCRILGNENNLLYLDLSNNKLSNSGAKILYKWLLGNRTIVELFAASNKYMYERKRLKLLGAAKTISNLRYDVRTLIFLDRHINKETSVFSSYSLPFDILKYILDCARILEIPRFKKDFPTVLKKMKVEE